MSPPRAQNMAMEIPQAEWADKIESLVITSYKVEAAVADTIERLDDTCELLDEFASRIANIQRADRE